MKKMFILFVLVAMIFALVPAPKVSAQTQFPAYISGIQVFNMSKTADASVTLTYYNMDDGSTAVAGSATVSVPAFTSGNYFPAVTGSFTGSLVVASNQPTAVVSNLQNSAKTAMAAYVGASTGSTTVLLPLLGKAWGGNPYNTWFSVQNAGAATATINVTYSDGLGNTSTTIAPNQSKHFYQSTEPHAVKTTFSGSITSDQPIVAVVVQENSQKLFAYTGFGSETSATDLVFPLINTNNSNYQTGVQIQNSGTNPTDVTVRYTPSAAGTQCDETRTIAAGKSKTFGLFAFTGNGATDPSDSSYNSTCAQGVRFVGSAKVITNSANMPLNGIVNQSKPTNGEAYGAFNPALATNTVVMPLIADKWASNQYSTGFSIMNVSGHAVYVVCTLTTYTPAAPAAPVVPATIEAALADGQAMTPNNRDTINPGGKYLGAGSCVANLAADHATIDPAGKLVGTVNYVGLGTADLLSVYEGVNQ